MMHAEEEYLVNNKASKVVFEKLGSKVKDFIEFKGAYHELQKEPIKDLVHSKVLRFMKSMLKQ